MPKPEQPKRNKIVTTAWTGLWYDGEPGWRFSPYIAGKGHVATADNVTGQTHFSFPAAVTDRFFKVKVTVELLKDTRGRYITRRGKREPFSVRVGAVKP